MNKGGSEQPGAGEFERQLAQFRPQMLRFALWLARDRTVAEDVVQDAMVRAWKAQGDLKEPRALRQWLYTIVRREHARLHERKRLELTDIDALLGSEDMQLAQTDDSEIDDLRGAILALPEEYREPLVMQVLGGFSTTEIASELNLTQAAVLTRLFRARHKLRDALGGAAVVDEDDSQR
ncbi:MAG: sigma-70 family RNA polymerase sigma factor [Steroidobacteraceae bacterium]